MYFGYCRLFPSGFTKLFINSIISALPLVSLYHLPFGSSGVNCIPDDTTALRSDGSKHKFHFGMS